MRKKRKEEERKKKIQNLGVSGVKRRGEWDV